MVVSVIKSNYLYYCPVFCQVEVFESALANTAGKDLYKVLWLKSENSEVWLDRRTNYTRSLAVMSMVGYILGLGDRHPSNLMLDRHTGKILHIDFGDCFEVAMHREKFPEKIPFRLTRMLTSAMEVSGIEGNFRSTCEKVMTVLRENRDSLIAMLEAFVHDPLISWRLLGGTYNEDNSPGSSAGTTKPSSSSTSFSQMSLQQSLGGSRGGGGGGLHSRMPVDHRDPRVVMEEEEDEEEVVEEGGSVVVGGGSLPRPVPVMKRGISTESTGEEMMDGRGGMEEDGGMFNGRGAPPENGYHRGERRYSHEDEDGGGGEWGGGDDGSQQRYDQQARRPPPPPPPSTRADLHLEIGSLAASISANQTRFSSSVAHHSVAHSRLDHRSTRERELVSALGK